MHVCAQGCVQFCEMGLVKGWFIYDGQYISESQYNIV